MADVYATITQADAAVVERLAGVLELRAADPQQRTMRETYLSDVEFGRTARVLEVGCGTGAVTRALARWPGVGKVVGVDPSPIFVAKARDLGANIENLSFEQADGRRLPFDDEAFDVVVFHTTLCHIPEPERALAEACRALKLGGWLAIFDGDYATTTVAIGDVDPLQACADAAIGALVHDRWLVRRLPALLRSAGFDSGRFRSHGYVETTEPGYMLSLVERGAETLVASGRIGAETAQALKGEAHRRADAGVFFGYISYASVTGRKMVSQVS